MTVALFLSRLTLRRESAAVAPLLRDLAPEDASRLADVTHRLLWTAMPDEVRGKPRSPENRRAAFLWRAESESGKYYLLGPRPVDDSPYFRVESKAFEPALEAGDRLAFNLRVNATVDRKLREGPDGKAVRERTDIAMDLLHAQERENAPDAELPGRAARRNEAAEAAAAGWLTAQGEKHGFSVEALALEAYDTLRLPRRGPRATIGVFDLKGVVRLADAPAFLEKLVSGFGRAKAFGCGLMLIRRAP